MPVPGLYFTLAIDLSPDRASAIVRLAGEIDIDTRRRLAGAIDQLAADAPAEIEIDLGEVTFAGTVLSNFLTRLRDALPSSSHIMITRPNALVRYVLDAGAIGEIVSIGAVQVP